MKRNYTGFRIWAGAKWEYYNTSEHILNSHTQNLITCSQMCKLAQHWVWVGISCYEIIPVVIVMADKHMEIITVHTCVEWSLEFFYKTIKGREVWVSLYVLIVLLLRMWFFLPGDACIPDLEILLLMAEKVYAQSWIFENKYEKRKHTARVLPLMLSGVWMQFVLQFQQHEGMSRSGQRSED